jgi:hypothetical protein
VILAHIGTVPVEEALLPLTGAAGAGLLFARASIGSRPPFKRGWRLERKRLLSTIVRSRCTR